MQKVSTERQVEKELIAEIISGIGKTLKERGFSTEETETAKKLFVGSFKKAMDGSFKETIDTIVRVEHFKSAEYPGLIRTTPREKQRYDRIMKSLQEAEDRLKSLLGDEFVALTLVGSYARGDVRIKSNGSSEKSDFDLYLLLRNERAGKRDKAYGILDEIFGKVAKTKIVKNCYGVEEAKELIRNVRQGEEFRSDIAAQKIFPFFTGMVFGDKIDEARKVSPKLLKNKRKRIAPRALFSSRALSLAPCTCFELSLQSLQPHRQLPSGSFSRQPLR
jgi:predicted nucleotidyltransferase